MTLEQKIAQMYKALGEMQVTEKLPAVKPEFSRTTGSVSARWDFQKGVDAATAANKVSQLLNSIACLKDHLKVWCNKNGKQFAGDALINSNKDVAIVHDLWNLDKHAELDRSRSGLFPRFESEPRSSMVLKAVPGNPQAMVAVTIGGIHPGEGASLRIVARVVDKDGKLIDDFENICERAVAAWEAEFKKVGLVF